MSTKYDQKRMNESEGVQWASLRTDKVKVLLGDAMPYIVSDAPKNFVHLVERAIARRVDERYNSADDKRSCIKSNSIPASLDDLMQGIRPAPRQDLITKIVHLMTVIDIEPGKLAKTIKTVQAVLTSGTVKELEALVTKLEQLPKRVDAV